MSRGPPAFDPKKVYVGGCPKTTEEELRELFGKYGPVERVWVAKSPPGFAFMWMADDRDAADAVKGLDGYVMSEDQTLVVAIARGPRGHDRDRVDRARDDPYGDRGRAPPPREMDARPRRPKGPGGFRVRVHGLPANVDWRDLKDGFRKSGDVCYANATGEDGIVEYSSEADRQRCIQDFHEAEFMGNTIRVEECEGSTKEYFAKTSAQYPERYGRGRSPPRRDRYDDRYDRRGYDDRYDDRRGPPPRRDYDDYDRRGPPRDDYRRGYDDRDYDRRGPPRGYDDRDRRGYDDYDRRGPPRDDYDRRGPPPRDDRDYPPRERSRSRER